MKYIIIEENKTGNRYPIIFHKNLIHLEVANRFRAENQIVGAGFVDFKQSTGVAYVYGESVSLNMQSKPEDAELINKSFKN